MHARCYSLAAFFAAWTLLGFVRSTRTGAWSSRLTFAASAAGLFAAHYALALLSVVTAPDSRARILDPHFRRM